MIKDFKLKNYYNNIDNNHLYKGTSFRCNEWAPNTKYFNNQDYIDFVFKNNCLFMCVKNHVSNGLNEPITYDNGRTVLKDETYWKLVVAGEAQSELVIPDASSSNQVLTSDSQGSWSWKDLSQITLAKGKIESVENIEDTYVSIEPVSTLARSASSNMYVLNMGIYNGKDGKDGKDGNPGEPGKDGIQVQYIYKLSANPTIEWFETEAVQNDDHVPDGWSNKLLEVTGEYPYQFESTRIKRNGLWEVWLKPTLRNQLLETMPSRLTSFIFCRVPDLGDTYEIEVPSGGSYDNPIPSTHGKFTYLKNGQWTEYIPTWYDSVPSGKGNVWMTKATFSQFSTAKMIWDTPILMADSESRQVEYVSEVSSEQLAGLYSISDSKYNFGLFDNNSYNSLEEREKAWRSFISYNLNINCYDASEMADQDAVYMLECTSVDKGFTWSDWKVIRIKGENGTNISPKGHLDSLPECNDTNYKLGDCVYVDGHMYIHNGDSICEDGSSCCWVDFGDVKGSHVHIKYAVKVDEGGEEVNIAGTNISLKFTDQNGDVPGDYVGTMVSDNEDPSIYMKDYKWTRWRGEDGWGYEYVFTGWYEKSTPEMVADGDGTKIDNAFIDSDEYQADGYRPYARKKNSKDVYTYQRCEDDLPPLDATENRYIWRATRKRVDGKWGAFSEFKLHSSWAQGVEQVVDYYAWSDASDYNGEIALSQFYVDKKFVEATITTDSSGNEFYWVLSDSKGSKPDGYVNQWLHNVTITLYDTGHSNITVTTLYKQAADGKAVKDIKSYYKLSEDNLLADTIRFNPDSWFTRIDNQIQNYTKENKQYVVAFDAGGGDYIIINNKRLYCHTKNDGISVINELLENDIPITNLWITTSFIVAFGIRGLYQLIQYVSKNNGFIFISDDNTIFPEVDLEAFNNSFPPSNKLKLYINVAPNKLITSTKHWSLIVTPESLYNDYCTYDWSTDTNLSVSVDYPYLFEKVATTISDNITTETIWSPPHIISTYQSPGYATYKFMASNTPPKAPQNDAAEGWFDAPILPGTGETLYVTSKMIYDDGKIRDNTWSDPKPLVDSNVFQVEYSSDYDGRSALPNFTEFLGHDAAEKEWRNKAKTDKCGTWTDDPGNAVYMATCQISGAVASDWTVMKVRGEDAYHLELSNDVDQIYVVEGNIQKTQVVSTTAQVFCGGSPEEGWKYSCDFGKFNDNQWTYTYDQNDVAECKNVTITATKNDVELTKIFKIICLSSSNDYDLKLSTGIVHVNKNWGFSHNTIDVNITQTTIGAEGDTKILTEWNNLTVKYRIDNNAEILLEGKQITLTNLSSPQKITVNLYQGETLIDTAYVEFICDGKDGADGTGIDIVGSYGTIAELEIAFSDGSITQDSTGLNKGDAFIVNGNLLYVYTDNGDTFDEAFECIDYAGEDGYSNEQIFILSNTEPDCPPYDGIDTSVWNAIDYIPTGWSDTPLTPTKDKDCYVAVRKNNGSETQTHIAFHGKRVGNNYSTKAILYSNYAKDGQDSTVPGPQGTSITNVAVYYCKIGSSVTAPDTGDNLIGTQWHSTVKWEQGQYIWSSIRTQLSDGTVTWSKPVCVTGFKGDSGTSSTLTHQYAISTSYSTFIAYNGSTWSSTCPTVPNGTYLWVRISINGVVSSQYCASGEKGDKGDYGKMIYPAGYYNVETQYVATDTAAPYVSYSGKMYVYNSTTSTNNPPLKADGTLNTGWLEMESFAAIYTDILFADFAKVGQVIFYNNLMFSQNGTGVKGYDNIEKNKNALDLLDSDPTQHFIPNFAIDCVEGTGYFAGGRLRLDGSSVDGNFSYQNQMKSLDGTDYYTSHRIYHTGGSPINICLQSSYITEAVLDGVIVGTQGQIVNFYEKSGDTIPMSISIIDASNVLQYVTVPDNNGSYRIDLLNRLKVVTTSGQPAYIYNVRIIPTEGVFPGINEGKLIEYDAEVLTQTWNTITNATTSVASESMSYKEYEDGIQFYASVISAVKCQTMRVIYKVERDGVTNMYITLINLNDIVAGSEYTTVERSIDGTEIYDSFILYT